MNAKKVIPAVVIVLSITCVIVPLTAGERPSADHRPITVMTWNLYLGGNIGPLLQATSQEDLIEKVTLLWASVQQTDFRERARVIAKEIARRGPDFIGLQEAVLWRVQSPGDFIMGNFVPNAETVIYDFIEILLDALEEQGRHYEVLAVVEGLDAEAPDANLDDIRLTDRDVILARAELQPMGLEISNVQEENFESRIVLDLLGLVQVEILSNWASVDVHTKDRTLRFVSTHLSAFSQSVRVGQAEELLSGPLDTDLPVILVGDLNSDAAADAEDSPAYHALISDGFRDSWWDGGIGDGFTAHQNGDLLNPATALDRRIDIVLCRGDLRILRADLSGEEQKDRTPSGLWPSDHAGVSGKLKFRH